MNCPKCGKSNEGSASFCMHCGAAITPQPIETPKQAAEKTLHAVPQRPMMRNQEPSKSSKWVAISLGIAVLVLALLAFGIFGLGLLRTKANTPQVPNVLNTTGAPNSGPSVVAVQGNPSVGPNITNTTGQPTPSVQPPQDIVDWLAHLKRIEKKRSEMGNRQEGELRTMASDLTKRYLELYLNFDTADLEKFQQQFQDDVDAKKNQLQSEWAAILVEFQQYPPPATCRELGTSYENLIIDYPLSFISFMNKIKEGIAKGNSQKPTELKVNATDIRKIVNTCNSQLQALCTKYNINRDFEIEQEGGNTNSISGITQ